MRWLGPQFLILAVFFCGLALARSAQAFLPASSAFQAWLQQERTSGRPAFSDAQTLATGLSLAQARALEMRALIEADPAEFVRHAMPEAERAQLPASIQALVEQRVKGRGFFGVYCAGLPQGNGAGQGGHGGYASEIRLNGKTYHGFVFGKWRDQTTVYEASIEGITLGDAIAIGDSPTPTEQAAAGQQVSAYSPTTTGPNTLLYMIARFSDQTNDPVSDATALSQMPVVSNFWMNCSGGSVYIHGRASPTQVVDIVHITLPQPSSYAATYNNNFGQLLSDARNAALALQPSYNYANYNLDVVVTTSGGFSYAGRSYIGSQGSHWVTPYTTLRTAGHELGHNLGLWHANYWRTDSTQPFGKDSNPGGYAPDTLGGEWIEYGHYFSVMSAQYGGEWDDATKPIYNPAEKVQLGWLSGSEVQYVTASGTYRLFRHDARNTVGNPRGIRIETPATDYTGAGRRYWLQYRYAPWSTAQSWYQNGVEVDVCQTGYGSDGSTELDMTPYSKDDTAGASWTDDNTDKLDGALIVGRSYDDLNAGIHVTPIATGNNGAGEEYIDVAINLGGFSANHSPVITALTATTNQVGTGQSVNFSVAASDPDGDALAYAWDFDQVQTWTASGLNSSSATKSWSSAGQYRVMVTVSDMKGGTATASQIITVGAPASSGEIWGRVVWAGQGVYGARVSSTSGNQAWTDSDGSYVLTDLAPGNSYIVNCQAAGLTFTSQFSNPVSLTSGTAFGVDFYANETLSGGGGATYTISGQVTDGATGVAGVEVRGGGMVATTDSGGNYQMANLVNGTYTLTPRYNNWAFSPATRSVTISSANSTGNNFSRAAPYSITGQFSGIPAGSQSPAPMVYLSNGRSVQATKTGTGPNKYWIYTLNTVPAGQYSLGAELSGYNIVPSGFSNPLTVGGNLTGMNFAGATASVAGAISGKITQRGVPVSGATVQANQSGSTVATTATDSDGYYRFENLASGSYTIVPSKTGYSFSPGSLSVTFIPSSGNDFTAIGPTAPPVISPLTATPTAVSSVAATTTLTALASGAGTLTYGWDATVAAGPVTFSVNDSPAAASTTVSFQLPGSYTFRARVTDSSGLPTTATVNVTVSAGPGSMVVAPYEAQVPGGQSVSFRADAWDQLGNRISVTPLWSADGGGSIDGTGVFTAAVLGGPYHVSATAGALSATGSVWVTSPGATMPPVISTQPANQSRPVGSNATFTVVATGSPPLSYQWFWNGGSIGGATSSSYTRTNIQTGDAGNYSVLVTNVAGTATSSNAVLTVIQPPIIMAQPASQTDPVGSNASFSVTAGGTGPFNYQWRLNGGNISGATGSAYTRTNVQPVDAGNYSVVVTNMAGTAASSNATLTVVQPPTITTQPLSQAVAAGSNVTFTVAASGTLPLTYQWRFGVSNISGANASTYTRFNVQSADSGSYTVVVSNSAAAVTSDAAILTVNNAPTLVGIADRTIHAGSFISFTNSASDADAPPQILTFSLDPGAPAGATIGATNGVFAWSTTAAQAGTTNPVTVRVADNGTPSLSDSGSFFISVVASLRVDSITISNSIVTLSWASIPGTVYQVQYKSGLNETQWAPVSPDVMAAGQISSLTDPLTGGSKFYRVQVLHY